MGITNFPNGISSMGIPILGGGPPPISGKYFHVNPRIGSDGNRGTTKEKPLDTFTKAEDLCTTDVGDGIIVWSQGNTAANTSTYLSASLDFDKSGITVFGVASGARMFGRARVVNLSTVNTLTYIMTVSGSNNVFYNMHFGNYGSDATALGCVRVTGSRNKFVNCHFLGGGHATPAADAGMYSLLAEGEENEYVNCTFGTDTIIRAQSNAEIVFDGSCRRNFFDHCQIISYSTTAGHGAIKIADATAIDGWTVFQDCTFMNWNTGALSTLTAAVIGSTPNNLGLLIHNPAMIGWAAWSANTDRVYITGYATASGAGGIATTV